MPTETTPPAPMAGALDLNSLPKPNIRSELATKLEAAAARASSGEREPEPAAEQEPTPVVSAAPKPAPPSPGSPKPPATPPGPSPVPKKEGIDAVREALERQTAKVKELEESGKATTKQFAEALAKEQAIAAKVLKYEEEIEKTYKPTVQRLADTEKRLMEREEALRIRDYTATTEWHDRYEKPMADIAADTAMLLADLIVTEPDGTQRRATDADFRHILAAPSHTDAGDRAEALFGKHAYQSVLNQRLRTQQAIRARDAAFKTAALESIEHGKRQQQNAAQFREQVGKRIQEVSNAELAAYKPDDSDTEMVEAYTQGLQFADTSIAGDASWTPEQYASTLGKARAKIASASVLEKRVSRLQAEKSALEEQLKAYQKSEPGVEPRNGGQHSAPKNTRDDVRKRIEADMDKFASRF